MYDKISQHYGQTKYRTSGMALFKIDAPFDVEQIEIIAKIDHEDYPTVQSSTIAYRGNYIKIFAFSYNLDRPSHPT